MTDAAATLNDALLALDVAVRRVTSLNSSDRTTALREAHRAFLVAVAPLRIQGSIDAHKGNDLPANPQDAVLTLVKRVLGLAEEAGVPWSELVAVFNRERLEQR